MKKIILFIFVISSLLTSQAKADDGNTTNNNVTNTTINSLTDLPYQYISAIINGKRIDLKLYQNYPNPVRDRTTIKFEATKGTYAVLRIYNLLGKLMTVVFDGTVAEEENLIPVDMQNYPSGMYIYELQVEGLKEAKKMIVIK